MRSGLEQKSVCSKLYIPLTPSLRLTCGWPLLTRTLFNFLAFVCESRHRNNILRVRNVTVRRSGARDSRCGSSADVQTVFYGESV